MIEAALKRHLIDQPGIKRVVGKHVYAGRIPQGLDQNVQTALRIQRVGGDTFPDLPGEGDCELATIQIEAFARGQGAELKVDSAMREVRRVTTEDTRAGWIGHGKQRHWVMGMDTQRIGGPLPVGPVDNSDNWTQRLSRDIRITFRYGD